MTLIRVGIVGLGANTRQRHVPGLRECRDVEIVAVCNRRPESTRQAAEEYSIPRTFERWEDLVAAPDVDAVVIGTWPYLHAPITIAALEAGKHVLTEARMAMNAEQARQMHRVASEHPELTAQIVPSPLGLRAHHVVKEMITDGYLGELREVVVLGTNASAADPSTPLHWRQSRHYSGLNMLALGILHEPLIRWIDDPTRVLAQTAIFVPERLNEADGQPQPVGTPDSVHILTRLPNQAQGVYHLSNSIYHGPSMQIHLYGSQGTIKYLLAPEDELYAAKTGEPLQPVQVPAAKEDGWRVESDFVEAIRGERTVEWTDFATGVRYMEFTEAVARSSESGAAVDLPLA